MNQETGYFASSDFKQQQEQTTIYIYIYNNTFCNLFIWQILTHLGKLFISFWCFLLFFCYFNLLYIVTGKKPGNQDLWSNSDIKLVSMDSAVCLPWVQVNIKLVRTGILWTVHAKMAHHNLLLTEKGQMQKHWLFIIVVLKCQNVLDGNDLDTSNFRF